jgi:enoyl-CoA hydratase/carnithine racemase
MKEVLKIILLMPLPVIAANNRLAFGNGSIIRCDCDF